MLLKVLTLIISSVYVLQASAAERTSIRVELTPPVHEFELTGERTVLTRGANGEPTSVLVQPLNDDPIVVGLSPNRRVAVLNAYLGFRTLVGVEGGLELFRHVRLGIHGSVNPSMDFKTQGFAWVSSYGVHAAVDIFREFEIAGEKVTPYASFNLNRFNKTANSFGDYSYGSLNGNQKQIGLGATIVKSSNGVLKFEAGYSESNGTYTGNYRENWAEYPDTYFRVGERYRFVNPYVTIHMTVYLKKR